MEILQKQADEREADKLIKQSYNKPIRCFDLCGTLEAKFDDNENGIEADVLLSMFRKDFDGTNLKQVCHKKCESFTGKHIGLTTNEDIKAGNCPIANALEVLAIIEK